MTQIEISREVAAKVLSVVDAGLSEGVGKPEPGQMCVEAAVCYALGLPHGDDPKCVSQALRRLKINLNDSKWSSNAARGRGLRRLAVAQLGSAGVLDEREFAKRCAELAVRKMVPLALRAAASIQKHATHKQKLIDAANRCEKDGTREAALEGKTAAATAAYDAADAADAAYAAANAADAAANAADAAYAAANAADAADAAYDAAAYAAYAAANAATAAYAAANARDKILSDFAEDVVQILVALRAPGCAWLDLTEAA
jgi:hypothetical protein